MPVINFSVSGQRKNKTKIEVKAGDFTLIVDEPENLGGTNDGPNPVEYVLAALAGCLNVVGHLAAEEMGFELKDLKIDIEGDLDPAKFSGKKTDARAGYQEIRATMKPDTDADQAALEKWVETVEERCPVSDNLANTTPVKISVN